jgi:hypothetical protein
MFLRSARGDTRNIFELEPIENKEGRQIIWQQTPINIISPKFFHLKRIENGKYDSLSEANLQSSKTSRDSYLEPKLAIFVKLLNFDPVPLRKARRTLFKDG